MHGRVVDDLSSEPVGTAGPAKITLGTRTVTADPSTGTFTFPGVPRESRVKVEAPGKAVFSSQGCGACHTYTPAGPEAVGKIGPDLDKLAQYAQKANQGTVKQFAAMSITDPGAYVESGYQNVMPTSFANLPKKQLADLVAFLTQK